MPSLNFSINLIDRIKKLSVIVILKPSEMGCEMPDVTKAIAANVI